MFLKIASLIILFIIRLRLAASNWIMQPLRNRYNNRVTKLVRDQEKLDFKTRKSQLHLEFLNQCVENNVIPKFIQFHLADKELRNTEDYRKCLIKLLQKEVINKKRRFSLLANDLKSAKDELLLRINLFITTFVIFFYSVMINFYFPIIKFIVRNCLLLQKVLTMLVTILKQ